MNNSIVEVKDVTKRFGKFKALDGINMTLEQGEICGFIGPNGAGKTTTIRILMGMINASEGRAEIFGKDAWKDAVELHKRIAFVPGDVNLWPNLTGGEVIDLFLRLRKGKNKKYQEELIDRFDFNPRKKCRTYSKGNRQKVALVAALSAEADLYILDEPTSGLDPLMESVFQETMREVKKAGKTVLLSSHILSEVEELCDKVTIIKQGKIIESGSLEELRHLTRTSIVVKTKEDLTEMKGIQGIYELQEDEKGSLHFSVESEMLGEVIQYLGSRQITDLKCMPPTLEELFMSHYKEV
ncbi:ABC-2 type transport system ATP-binding protein [Aequitasia blattaphilus]|uniref:ABC transporter ATP-binding protein n=1 Tax=Aequitasia blattaphilus TaxID=2949332 RepID=A0ABT1EAN6_9FIRM|nr:ABC transporter ATP-binding protein [Aequitasia blattaphilus]MCP1102873.1 ABC transporter ATP-binding protein [Aequitasia blattaphilus]MCR8615513.1 ABC transporter ATP-binding protein [Aequitasia blattaphilus]